MAKAEYPMTRGVHLLRARKVDFASQLYPYEVHGGTRHAARCLEVDEHAVIKTLVMEAVRMSPKRHSPSYETSGFITDDAKPFLVLMHGDREVSTKKLARALGVKAVKPCDMEKAQRVTGYQVGGISPFGTRRPLPVYVESTILSLARMYINGGKRGFLVEIDPRDLRKVFSVQEVDVGIMPA